MVVETLVYRTLVVHDTDTKLVSVGATNLSIVHIGTQGAPGPKGDKGEKGDLDELKIDPSPDNQVQTRGGKLYIPTPSIDPLAYYTLARA